MTVINLGEHAGSAIMMTPEQTLERALSNVGKKGSLKDGQKCIVLALDDTSGEYSVNFYQAGMKMSECVSLCEIAESIFKKEMGY